MAIGRSELVLREMSAKCSRLALGVCDEAAAIALMKLAAEYEAMADRRSSRARDLRRSQKLSR